MLSIRPLSEQEASGETKEIYTRLKKAFGLPSVPLFFLYLGPFPEYLSYIAKQIIANVEDPRFQHNIQDTSGSLKQHISSALPKGEMIQKWSNLYSNSPSYYHFQQNLKDIFQTNIQLAYIFVSLREALKGWAVAAKKIGSTSYEAKKYNVESQEENNLVFGDVMKTVMNNWSPGYENKNLNATSKSLAQTQSNSLEKDLLPDYLELCKLSYSLHMKREAFLHLRVWCEELVLADIQNLPQHIFSPINVILQYTGKYTNFPDLLYLLTEHFPTYAVQRMIFSGFMME